MTKGDRVREEDKKHGQEKEKKPECITTTNNFFRSSVISY